MNFTREQLIATLEYINAVNDGYKIFTQFNDHFMRFSIQKNIKGNKYDTSYSIEIYDLHYFKYFLKKQIEAIEERVLDVSM